MSSYFPIPCGEFHVEMVEHMLADEVDFVIDNFGMYFTLLSMFKAHGIETAQMEFIVGKHGGLSCSFDAVEENELGTKVSRIPILLPDAIVVSILGDMPIVIYGPAGTDFTFKIDKGIPKDKVFSFICEEVVRAEKMKAIDSQEDQ
jgi:hypothetical protein